MLIIETLISTYWNFRFNMTFSAPATVRVGDDFTPFITVTNISDALANLVSVSFNQAQLAGATLLSAPSQTIDLDPGDSELLRYEFRSNQTGQVTASYLSFDQKSGGQNTGDLRFTLGVGERGAPLSPDTLVLPTSASALPSAVVDVALRVLGQGWSLATAPSGTIPDGVLRVSKQTVLDRAAELAEAGFRIQLGESVSMALENLAFSWASTDEAAFDQLLRETRAGRLFFETLGQAIASPESITDFQRELSLELTSRRPHILLGIGDGLSSAPIIWQLADAAGRSLAPGAAADIENAAYLTLAEPASTARGLALVTRLGSSLYEWSFTADAAGSFDFGVSLPRPDGATSYHVFSGVMVSAGDQGRVSLDLLASAAVLTLEIDRDGDGVFEETIEGSPEEILTSPGPTLLSATAIGPETLSGADPWGRVVALLFDREMRRTEAELASHYSVEENGVISAIAQLSGRLVFLFLESPVSDFVPRQATASVLFSVSGEALSPASVSVPIGSLITDPGAVVSGQVLNADGTPVLGASVLYINANPVLIGVAQKTVDADGRYQFDYVRQSPRGRFTMRAVDPETGALQELTTRVGFDGEHIVVDLVLLGRGGVTGIVRDTSGEPVANAQVLVTSGADPTSFALVETDGAGRYVATDIVVGAVTVKAVFDTSSGIAAGNLQRAGTFTSVDVTINLTAGRVSGGVFELDGGDVSTPVGAIEVFYLIPLLPTKEIIAAQTMTGENGRFAFEGVPAGPFRVAAIDRVRSRQASASGELVVVGGEAIIEELDVIFFTEDVGTIEGRVSSADGNPAEGVVVSAAGRQVLTASSGDGSGLSPGGFQFTGIAFGTYTVTANKPGSSAISSVQAVVADASVPVNVSLVLPGSGRVTVTVLDVDGTPIPNLQVLRASGCAGIPATTGSDPSDPATFGVAVFEDVRIGNVHVKAVRGADLASASAVIRRDDDEAALVLRFAGFGTVTGAVIDPAGAPVLGARVVLGSRRLVPSQCLFINDGAAQQVQTGVDGLFRFNNVSVGAITISASTVFFPVATTVRDALLVDGDLKDFELQLASNIAGELNGTIFLPDGTTPAGVGVDVTVSGGSLPDVTVRTDASGGYSFAKIFPASRYTLSASDAVTGKRARATIFLQEDQDLTVDLRLLGRSSVEVTVVDGTGALVEEAFVELSSAGFPFDRAAGAITPSDGGKIVFDRIYRGRWNADRRNWCQQRDFRRERTGAWKCDRGRPSVERSCRTTNLPRYLFSGGAYTRFFEVPFIYDDLRDQGLRSIVIDQQAGLGLGNRNDTDQADDVWERFNFKFADTLALEVLNLAFGESSNSSGLDEDARQGAVAHIARTRGEFDLMVIYLAGLDHYLHEQGVSNNQGSDFFLTQVDDLFDESLHDNINVIVKTIEEKIGDQATIYGVFADHGHFDVDPEKRMDFDNNGSVLEDRGFLEWNAVLAPDKKFRVGNRYEEPSADRKRKDSNVIFDGLWSFLNVYVAGDIVDSFTYDWTKPPSLDDLELIVNQIAFSYMFTPDGGPSPIADVMVRVPSSEFPDDFDKSFYTMLRRDYHPARVDCGSGGLGTGDELCGLLPQLMTLEDYFTAHPGMGDGAEFPFTFNNPVNRIRDWISTNSGDIVVFGNARQGYQFANKPYKGQHGSLTYADSLVPIAFGYPGATGDATQDTTLQLLRDFVAQLVTQTSVSVDSGEPVIQAIAEAEALRAFFGLPAVIRPHGSDPP